MKNRILSPLLGIVLFAIGLCCSSCGSSGGTVVLTVVPAGPVIVLKDDTLQLTASRSDVTWSVQGGGDNGTVSAAGLYTPPGTIPLENPQVTVQVESSDGQIAMALLNLRTGTTLAFGSPVMANDTEVRADSFSSEAVFAGVSDRLAARLGSVQEDSIWTQLNMSVGNVFYSQEIDFGGFSAERNLNNDAALEHFAVGIETNGQLDPGILYLNVPGGALASRLFFIRSPDGGATFGAPQGIPTTDPHGSQSKGFMRLDSQDNIHLAFQEDPLVLGPSDIFYTRSDDGGMSWTTPPVPVFASAEKQENPSLGVDPSGEMVWVCWTELGDIQFARSSNGGDSFGTPIPLTSSAMADNCRIARGPSGEVYVSVVDDDDNDGNWDFFLFKSTDGGASFPNAPTPINSIPINTFIPTFGYISVDSLGRIDAVWMADPDVSGDFDTLRYARSVNGGGAFSPDQTLDSGPSGSLDTGSGLVPSGLRHDEAGRLYVQYYKGETEDTAGTGNILVLVGE